MVPHVNNPRIAQADIETEFVLALAQTQWPVLEDDVWDEIVRRRLLLRLIAIVNLGMAAPR